MVPSSFMTSQITPDGFSPASRARSTAASVCPVRSRTPPSLALSGKTWPGWTRSLGPECGSIATWIVRARSAAEIPVVTPSRASTETVNAVWKGASFFAAIRLSASGVANWAASVRSPSFSRFSSSQTTTIRPRRMSSIASSAVAKGESVFFPLSLGSLVFLAIQLLLVMRGCSARKRPSISEGWHAWAPGQLPPHVAGEHVALHVEPIAELDAAERGALEGLGDQRDLQAGLDERGDGEAHALDRDRSPIDHVREELVWELEPKALGDALLGDLRDRRGAIDMSLDDVAADAVGGSQRQLEVDGRLGGELAQRGQGQRLLHDVRLEGAVPRRGRGETGAVDRHGISVLQLGGELRADPKAGAVLTGIDRVDPAELPDDPGEHRPDLTTPAAWRGSADPRRRTRTRSPGAGRHLRSARRPLPPAPRGHRRRRPGSGP